MGLSPRAGLFGGVALLSAAVVLLQIVLTRLFSALLGYHFGFLAISLALLGAGAGGALLYAIPSLARPPGLLSRLSIHAALASGATLAALLFLARQKPFTALEPTDLKRVALLYAVCALPFLFAGIAVAGAVRFGARDMSKLYVADLGAAATGGFLALLALRLGAPRAMIATALLFGVASLWFALPMRRISGPGRSPLSQRAPGMTAPFGLVATMLLGGTILFLGDLGSPWLKLTSARDARIDRAEFQQWSLLSLITVDRPIGGIAWLRTDGGSQTAILDIKTNAPLHPDEMGYVLHRGQGPALVLGAGGGRDIRAALKAGQTRVDAVEIDPVIVNDVMRGAYRDFSGDLFSKPQVHVHITDARSFVRSAKEPYRAIVLSLVDTWAASATGALAPVESSLYTVEAFRDYLTHLTPEGTLTVNRWDAELPRLLALAAAGLRATGSADPKSHLFACSHDRTTAVLIKRTPFEKEEILKLRRHCNQHHFREIFSPDVKRGVLLEAAVATPGGFIDPSTGADLRPPTDDHPFFFHTLPASALPHMLATPRELLKQHQGVALIAAVFVVSAALALLFVILPVFAGFIRARLTSPDDPASSGAPRARPQRARALLFFGAIGAGFVLVEVGLVQQLTVFLGHPLYAVTTVLATLLLAAGAGSLSTSRVALAVGPRIASGRAQVLVAVLSLYAVGLGPVLGRAMVLGLGARALFTVALLLPLGALMGSLAPLGIKLLAPRSSSVLPWAWGLGGLGGVMATAAGALLAMSFGFSAVLWLAGAAYLLAAFAVPRYAGEPPPSSATTPLPEMR
ncbi:MAG: hypothetical protein R3B70_31275 [Polyangiaceae bacterium]